EAGPGPHQADGGAEGAGCSDRSRPGADYGEAAAGGDVVRGRQEERAVRAGAGVQHAAVAGRAGVRVPDEGGSPPRGPAGNDDDEGVIPGRRDRDRGPDGAGEVTLANFDAGGGAIGSAARVVSRLHYECPSPSRSDMDAERAKELAERDQLWASLRAL